MTNFFKIFTEACGVSAIAGPLAPLSTSPNTTRTGGGGHLGPPGCATDVFAYSFPRRHASKHITFKELHAVVHAVELFSKDMAWRNRVIVVHTDNTGITGCIPKGYIRQESAQALLRRLWLVAAAGGFTLTTQWLASEENSLADALSRSDWKQARTIDPLAASIALRRRQGRNFSIPPLNL